MITEWLYVAMVAGSTLGATGWTAAPVAPAHRASPAATPARDTVEAPAPLEVDEVVRSALGTHPGVAGAVARLGAAEAEAGQARSTLFPALLATGLATRYQEPMVVAPLHGFDPRTPPAFDETLYQGHATLEYTLFDGAVRGARIRGARSRTAAAAAGVESVRDEVVAGAVSSYLDALTAREVHGAHARQVEALESELVRARLLLAEGASPRVAVLRAEATLSEARAALEAADQELRLSLHRLVRISGLEPGRVSADALVEVAPDGEPVAGREALLASALETNPGLLEARERVAAAETAVRAARGAYLPRVALTGRYSAFGGASTDPQLEWQAGVQVSYPVFTGGSRAREVERASALADAARAEAELAARRVADAVDAGLLAYRSAGARVEALEAAVAQSEEVARIEALALEAGAGVQTDYLRAEAALLRARAGLASARHALVAARVRLGQVTGRLDVDWLTPRTEGVER